MPRLVLTLTKYGCLLAILLMITGCGGTYDKRLQQRMVDLKGGKVVSGAAPIAAPNAVDPRLYAGQYEITLANGERTGVKLNLPKEFVNADGSANFMVAAAFPGINQVPGAQSVATVHFYNDTSGKKLPVVIHYMRDPQSKSNTAQDRQKIEGEQFKGLPPIAFADFPAAIGNLRRAEFPKGGKPKFPVGDLNGPQEAMDGQMVFYYIFTAQETIGIAVSAPASVSNTFDFFGAMEASMKGLQGGPPGVTGAITP